MQGLNNSHCSQHQHHSQINSDDCFKEERLEIDSYMADKVEEQGGKVDGQDVAQDSSAENHVYSHPFFRLLPMYVLLDCPLPYKVLAQLLWSVVLKIACF